MTLDRTRSMAKDDQRVVASREALLAIPQWRLIKQWRAVGVHVDLLNRVIAERLAAER